MRNLFYQNWTTASRNIRESEGVLLTLGSVEEHGLHLPLGTDTILAHAFAQEICEREDMYYYPCITYGQVWSAREFESTISISPACLENYCLQAVESVMRASPRRIILYSFHNGNHKVIEEVLRTLADRGSGDHVYHMKAAGIDKKAGHILTTPLWNGSVWHAGELETSLMLYVKEELVDMKAATAEFPPVPLLYGKKPVPWRTFIESGAFGDASAATAEKGRELFELICRELQEQIRCIKEGENYERN